MVTGLPGCRMRAESGLPDPAGSLTLEFPGGIVPAMTAGAKIAKVRMRAECLQRGAER